METQRAGSGRIRPRLSRRAARRLHAHVLLAAGSGLLVAAIGEEFSAPLLVSLSGGTAYASLLLLALTLLLGPINVLLRRPNPVSSDLRRDCGIWAAALGIVHAGLALWRLLPSDFWRAFALATDQLHLDSPGLANDLGLAATALLVLLLLLSSDRALGLLGSRRWKSLQRLSYVLFVAAVLHTLLYQRLAEPGALFIFLLPVLAAGVLVLQLAGWLKRRRRARLVGANAGAKAASDAGIAQPRRR